jgi:hypothetical protein
MSKCPVCNWEIKDKGVTVQSGGRSAVVCCAACAEKFKKAPAKK